MCKSRKNKAGTVVTVRGLVATEENKPAAIKVSFTSKKTKKTSKYTFASKVTVVGKAEEKPEVLGIKEVKQNKFTNFTATFSDKVTEIKAADLTIVRDSDNENIVVKSATVDTTDATKVTIETYKGLTDGATYTVTYTAADEAKTQTSAKVIVTDGTVASVNVTPLEISYNTRTTISYQTIDKNGVIISEYPVRANKESKVEIDFTSSNGTLDDDTSKLILYSVGDTATFKVTYHTYKYTTSGEEEGAVSDTFTVKAVESANTLSGFTYTAINDSEPYDWKTVTPRNFIAVNDYDGDGGTGMRTAWFYITDAKGAYVTKDLDYTVESSDNSVLIADGTVKEGATLMPVAVGKAYLNIKDTTGNVIKTLPIEVKAKRTLATLSLDKTSVTVVTGAPHDLASITSQAIKASVKDNYGDDYRYFATEIKPVVSTKNDAEFGFTAAWCSQIISVGTNNTAKPGTQTYKITVSDTKNDNTSRTQTADVKMVSRAGNITKQLVITDPTGWKISSIDSRWDADKTTGLKATVVNMVNGAVLGALDFTPTTISQEAFKITKANGTILATTGTAARSAVKTCDAITFGAVQNTITDGAVEFSVANGGIKDTRSSGHNGMTKYMGADTYTFKYYFEIFADGRVTKYEPYATLKVTDSDPGYTANVLTTSTDYTSVVNFFNDKDNVEIFCGSVKMAVGNSPITKNEYVVTGADYSTNDDKTTAFVKTVTARVSVAGKSNEFINVKINVNRSIKTSGKWA